MCSRSDLAIERGPVRLAVVYFSLHGFLRAVRMFPPTGTNSMQVLCRRYRTSRDRYCCHLTVRGSERSKSITNSINTVKQFSEQINQQTPQFNTIEARDKNAPSPCHAAKPQKGNGWRKKKILRLHEKNNRSAQHLVPGGGGIQRRGRGRLPSPPPLPLVAVIHKRPATEASCAPRAQREKM